jgi:hypothetical protein
MYPCPIKKHIGVLIPLQGDVSINFVAEASQTESVKNDIKKEMDVEKNKSLLRAC